MMLAFLIYCCFHGVIAFALIACQLEGVSPRSMKEDLAIAVFLPVVALWFIFFEAPALLWKMR